ncbi:hypothetical protein D3C76_1512550 [compost metagenome]
MAQVAQLLGQQQAIGRVIIDHQDTQRPVRHQRLGLDRRRGRQSVEQGEVQQDLDLRARPHHAAQRQGAAHHFAQGAADDQPQPGTAARRLGRVAGLGKGAEQAALVLRRNPAAGVLDAQANAQASVFNV